MGPMQRPELLGDMDGQTQGAALVSKPRLMAWRIQFQA